MSEDSEAVVNAAQQLVDADEKLYEHASECMDDPCTRCGFLSIMVEGAMSKTRILLRQLHRNREISS